MREDGGENALRQLAQLGDGLLRVIERLCHELGRGPAAGVQPLLRQFQRHDRVDEALLGPVMQIADNSAPLLVGGRHEPRSGRRELRSRLFVRDGGGHELTELPDARLGFGGQRRNHALRGDHDTP